MNHRTFLFGEITQPRRVSAIDRGRHAGSSTAERENGFPVVWEPRNPSTVTNAAARPCFTIVMSRPQPVQRRVSGPALVRSVAHPP